MWFQLKSTISHTISTSFKTNIFFKNGRYDTNIGVQAAIARSSHAEAVRRVGAARRASVAFAAARNDIAARMAARRRSISGSNNNGKRRVFSQGKTRSR